jgi:hypothetical protein
MFHPRTTTKGCETGVSIATPTAMAPLSRKAPGTMFRLGFAAIALACGLIAVSGDARARQETPDEQLAYCTRLHGLYWKYHANYFHHDGTWAEAELARHHCDHGNFEPGTKQLERMLRNDLFVMPSESSPTSTGSAQR